MEKLEIVDTNVSNIAQFGMCGYRNTKNEGYRHKLAWLAERYPEGLRYKMLVSSTKGAVGGIEYLPGEKAWRPVHAEGYLFIHCIFIIPKEIKGQGYGRQLVQTCIDDAKINGKKGVAVVTRQGTWMAGRQLFLDMGFEIVDRAGPDFELLACKFSKADISPSFITGWEEKLKGYSKGLYILTSGQCPYARKAVIEITASSVTDFGITPKVIEINSSTEAQEVPCAFGSFCIIFNSKVIADHPVSQTRFKNIMKKELEQGR